MRTLKIIKLVDDRQLLEIRKHAQIFLRSCSEDLKLLKNNLHINRKPILSSFFLRFCEGNMHEIFIFQSHGSTKEHNLWRLRPDMSGESTSLLKMYVLCFSTTRKQKLQSVEWRIKSSPKPKTFFSCKNRG